MKGAKFVLLLLALLLFSSAVSAQDYCLLRKPQYMSDPCPCYQFYLASTTGDAPRAMSDGFACYITDIAAREGWEVDPNFGGPHDWDSGDEAMAVVSPYYDDYYGCNDCRSGGTAGDGGSADGGNGVNDGANDGGTDIDTGDDGNGDDGSSDDGLDGSGSSGHSSNYVKGPLLAGPVSIPAESTTPTDVGVVLEEGKPYIIVGEGECSLWDDKTDGVDSCFCYAQWRIGDTPQVWGQLKLIDPTAHLSGLIEEQTGAPPVYNSAHVYEGVAFGEGKPLKAIVYDGGGYSDNHGTLQISVYEAVEA